MNYQNGRGAPMSGQQTYMTNPHLPSSRTPPSNGAHFHQDCGNPFRGHPYPPYLNSDYPPTSDLAAPPNVAVGQPPHGQTLTLNQLLLQGNSPNPQRSRSSGSMSQLAQQPGYRYEHYGYAQKMGSVGHPVEENSAPSSSGVGPPTTANRTVSPTKDSAYAGTPGSASGADASCAGSLAAPSDTLTRNSRSSTPGQAAPSVEPYAELRSPISTAATLTTASTVSDPSTAIGGPPSSSTPSAPSGGYVTTSTPSAERMEPNTTAAGEPGVSPSACARSSGPNHMSPVGPSLYSAGPRSGYNPMGMYSQHPTESQHHPQQVMGGGSQQSPPPSYGGPGGYPPPRGYPMPPQGLRMGGGYPPSSASGGGYSMMPPPPPPPGPMGYAGTPNQGGPSGMVAGPYPPSTGGPIGGGTDSSFIYHNSTAQNILSSQQQKAVTSGMMSGSENATGFPPCGGRGMYVGGQQGGGGGGSYPIGDPGFPRAIGGTGGYQPMMNGVAGQRISPQQQRGAGGPMPLDPNTGRPLPAPGYQMNNSFAGSDLSQMDPAFSQNSNATRAESRDGSVSSRMSDQQAPLLQHQQQSPCEMSPALAAAGSAQPPRPPSYGHMRPEPGSMPQSSKGTKDPSQPPPLGTCNSAATDMFMKEDRLSMSEQQQQYLHLYRNRMPSQSRGGLGSPMARLTPPPPMHQQQTHSMGYGSGGGGYPYAPGMPGMPLQGYQQGTGYPPPHIYDTMSPSGAGYPPYHHQQHRVSGYPGSTQLHHHHHHPQHPGSAMHVTPQQAVQHQQHPPPPPHNLSPQSGSCFSRILEMGNEPERRSWLEHYMFFMEEIGKPLTGLPQVVKQPLDLYRFYLAVRERGGVLEVIKSKRWKEISQIVNINASASAAYTLRKNYCKYLLDYECRFDRGAVDTRLILSQIESMSGKKKKTSVSSASGGGEFVNESSTSTSGGTSTTPFPPPSPVGSHSSASSSLMPVSGGPGGGGGSSGENSSLTPHPQQPPLQQQQHLARPPSQQAVGAPSTPGLSHQQEGPGETGQRSDLSPPPPPQTVGGSTEKRHLQPPSLPSDGTTLSSPTPVPSSALAGSPPPPVPSRPPSSSSSVTADAGPPPFGYGGGPPPPHQYVREPAAGVPAPPPGYGTMGWRPQSMPPRPPFPNSSYSQRMPPVGPYGEMGRRSGPPDQAYADGGPPGERGLYLQQPPMPPQQQQQLLSTKPGSICSRPCSPGFSDLSQSPAKPVGGSGGTETIVPSSQSPGNTIHHHASNSNSVPIYPPAYPSHSGGAPPAYPLYAQQQQQQLQHKTPQPPSGAYMNHHPVVGWPGPLGPSGVGPHSPPPPSAAGGPVPPTFTAHYSPAQQQPQPGDHVVASAYRPRVPQQPRHPAPPPCVGGPPSSHHLPFHPGMHPGSGYPAPTGAPHAVASISGMPQRPPVVGAGGSVMMPQHPNQVPMSPLMQRPPYMTAFRKRFDPHPFPPGCVEATSVEPTRRKRYRLKDIGNVNPSRLIMALRSGLPCETTWALNALNILLREDLSPSLENCFPNPDQLVSLLTTLADHLRRSLNALFPHAGLTATLELPANMTSTAIQCAPALTPATTKSTANGVPELFADLLDPSLLLAPIPTSQDDDEDQEEMRSKVQKQSPPPQSSVNNSLNGLVSLEQELAAIANAKGLSIQTLRNATRRLLLLRGRFFRNKNGLLIKTESCEPPAHATLRLQPTTAAGTSPTTGSRASNNLLMDASASTVITANSPEKRRRGRPMAAGPFSSTVDGVGSEDTKLPPLPSTPVVSASRASGMKSSSHPVVLAGGLSGPEAYTNLRRLALFVMNELIPPENDMPPPPPLLEDDPDTGPPVLLPADNCLSSAPSSPDGALSSAAAGGAGGLSMRELFIRGGADTSCYILPTFGATDPLTSPSFPLKTTTTTATKTMRTPSVSERINCSDSRRSISSTVQDRLTTVDGEDGPPAAKRARSSSSSSSSLPCPVLSPQNTAGEESLGGRLDFAPSTTVSTTTTSTTEVEDDELNSHRLMTDSKGYCPLRARSEIIRLGEPVLWPTGGTALTAETHALLCLCVSTVLRNFSFFPAVERCLSTHKAVLALMGRILSLGHYHADEAVDWASAEAETAKFEDSSAWWMPWQEELYENVLVLLVNIAGHLKCINLHEAIVRPLLAGLLHWVTCETTVAVDPLPGHRVISPCRLALETLNRLSVNESNVDMLLSTPDTRVLEQLFDRLASWLALPEDQITRELALSTMHYLSESSSWCQTDDTPVSSMTSSGSQQLQQAAASKSFGLSLLARAKPCPLAGLTAFIEAAEAKTRRAIDQYGVQALQEQPELMGTTLEMVRRAGRLLERLAANPVGRARFTPELELRLLGLATSRVLDAEVAKLLSGALFNLPTGSATTGNGGNAKLLPELPSPAKVSELLRVVEKTSLSVTEGTKDELSTAGRVESVSRMQLQTDPGKQEDRASKSNQEKREVESEDEGASTPGDERSQLMMVIDENQEEAVPERKASLPPAENHDSSDLRTSALSPSVTASSTMSKSSSAVEQVAVV